MPSDLKTKAALKALQNIKSAASRAALGLDKPEEEEEKPGEKSTEEPGDGEG